ncbi:MAG: NAD(P)-dependent oxidoreductase [Emcibacteraceae bacterium]|nr:NAD(P)-dependent oxidoreductase [Emcibacteraceae bacterium]
MTVAYSKVILTGGTGWLGRRLARALTHGLKELGSVGEGGKALKCLVLPGEDASELLELGAEVVYGDIVDTDACLELMRDGENSLVIHTAGLIHPRLFVKEFTTVNVNGTLNLLNAAATNKSTRMVVVSSNSPFGCNPFPGQSFTEVSPYNPYMGYGKSKQKMEEALLEAMKYQEYPTLTIIRPPWFYGQGQPTRQTDFFRMLKNGKFPLMGKGLNQRSMVFVDSLALGVLLAGYRAKAAGEIYWIADERPYTMLEIADTIKSVLSEDFDFNVKPKNLHVPAIISDVARLMDGSLQAIGIYHQKLHVLSEMNQTISCNISKAKRDLGYKPLCELREGMYRSIDWCLKNGQEI